VAIRFRRGLIAASVVAFAVTRWYILVGLQPRYTDVAQTYFIYAASVVDFHHVPYQDRAKVEYPPLAWWAMYLPRLPDARRISDPRDANQALPIYESYHAAFRGEMFLCDLASFALLLAIVHRRQPRLAGWAALAYVVATAILAHVLYDRLDVALLMLLMIWAFSWTRLSEETPPRMLWLIASYLAIGLSISYKLVPIICVPFLLLSEWRQPRRGTQMTIALATLLVAVVAPFLIQFFISGPGVLDIFSYHAGRGIQIESLYATAMILGDRFGIPAGVNFLHGSHELTGALAPVLKGCATALELSVLAGLGFLALRRGKKFDRQSAYRFSLLALAAQMILLNVLSPQYFIWGLPILILLAVEALPDASRQFGVLLLLLIVVAAATTWLFPFHYFSADSSVALVPVRTGHGGNDLAPGAVAATVSLVAAAVLTLRNFLYLALGLWVGYPLFAPARSRRSVSCNTPQPLL
jgi:hypothetical protein